LSCAAGIINYGKSTIYWTVHCDEERERERERERECEGLGRRGVGGSGGGVAAEWKNPRIAIKFYTYGSAITKYERVL
jgi:hypothetical protein